MVWGPIGHLALFDQLNPLKQTHHPIPHITNSRVVVAIIRDAGGFGFVGFVALIGFDQRMCEICHAWVCGVGL